MRIYCQDFRQLYRRRPSSHRTPARHQRQIYAVTDQGSLRGAAEASYLQSFAELVLVLLVRTRPRAIL